MKLFLIVHFKVDRSLNPLCCTFISLLVLPRLEITWKNKNCQTYHQVNDFIDPFWALIAIHQNHTHFRMNPWNISIGPHLYLRLLIHLMSLANFCAPLTAGFNHDKQGQQQGISFSSWVKCWQAHLIRSPGGPDWFNGAHEWQVTLSFLKGRCLWEEVGWHGWYTADCPQLSLCGWKRKAKHVLLLGSDKQH